MINTVFLAIGAIAVLAFFVKGATGFGPSIVLIALGSLLIEPQQVIVLATLTDVVGGLLLFRANRTPAAIRFWLPMGIVMMTGAIIGGYFLSVIPLDHFDLIISVVILVLGLWFIFGANGAQKMNLRTVLPTKCTPADLGVSMFAGLCGGFFGISGPPMVYHLGRKLAKTAFRQALIPIFLMAAIARLVTYTVTGLVTLPVLKLGAVALPGLLVGLYLGNHLFFKLSEQWFRRVVGIILVITALRLMM